MSAASRQSPRPRWDPMQGPPLADSLLSVSPTSPSARRRKRMWLVAVVAGVLMVVGGVSSPAPAPSETLAAAGVTLPGDVGVCLDESLRVLRMPADFSSASTAHRTLVWRALSGCDPNAAVAAATALGDLAPLWCSPAEAAAVVGPTTLARSDVAPPC